MCTVGRVLHWKECRQVFRARLLEVDWKPPYKLRTFVVAGILGYTSFIGEIDSDAVLTYTAGQNIPR